jgi:hypothetical protein
VTRQDDDVEVPVLIIAAEEAGLGGDPVCWAHLVCEECGAITSEGHRAGCSLAAASG